MTQDRTEIYNTINTMYVTRYQIRLLYKHLDLPTLASLQSNIESLIKHQLKNKCNVIVSLKNYIIQIIPDDSVSLTERVKNNLLAKISNILREFILSTNIDNETKDYVANLANPIFDYYSIGTSINLIV